MKERKFEVVSKNEQCRKIINEYPFRLKYKGPNVNEVSKKYISQGIQTRIIDEGVFTEAGRLPNHERR